MIKSKQQTSSRSGTNYGTYQREDVVARRRIVGGNTKDVGGRRKKETMRGRSDSVALVKVKEVTVTL
jgi:hypothetical protein